MKKFILFDNDGVLVDTEKYYFKANQLLFESLGHELSLEAYKSISLVAGKSVLDYFRKFDYSDDQILELRNKRDAIYEQFIFNNSLALPGVTNKLEELSGSFKMGIVTSTKRNYFDNVHNKTGFAKYFKFVVAREDYSESKPNPQPYLFGIKKSGYAPDEIVVIEDTPRGLESAKAAGLQCIIIKNEFTNDALFNGASIVLDSIDELTISLIRALE